jgi:hypothetical protein
MPTLPPSDVDHPGTAPSRGDEIPRNSPRHDANESSASVETFVRATVKCGETLLTNGHKSYFGLSDYRHADWQRVVIGSRRMLRSDAGLASTTGSDLPLRGSR